MLNLRLLFDLIPLKVYAIFEMKVHTESYSLGDRLMNELNELDPWRNCCNSNPELRFSQPFLSKKRIVQSLDSNGQ